MLNNNFHDYNFYWCVRIILLFYSLCSLCLYIQCVAWCIDKCSVGCVLTPGQLAANDGWGEQRSWHADILSSPDVDTPCCSWVLSWGSLTKICFGCCRYVGSSKYWFCALWWQIDTRFKSSNITHRGDGDQSWAAAQDVILASLKGFNLD